MNDQEINTRIREIDCDILLDSLRTVQRFLEHSDRVDWGAVDEHDPKNPDKKREYKHDPKNAKENLRHLVWCLDTCVDGLKKLPANDVLRAIRVELERVKRRLPKIETAEVLAKHFGDDAHGTDYIRKELATAHEKHGEALDKLIAEFVVWRESFIDDAKSAGKVTPLTTKPTKVLRDRKRDETFKVLAKYPDLKNQELFDRVLPKLSEEDAEKFDVNRVSKYATEYFALHEDKRPSHRRKRSPAQKK